MIDEKQQEALRTSLQNLVYQVRRHPFAPYARDYGMQTLRKITETHLGWLPTHQPSQSQEALMSQLRQMPRTKGYWALASFISLRDRERFPIREQVQQPWYQVEQQEGFIPFSEEPVLPPFWYGECLGSPHTQWLFKAGEPGREETYWLEEEVDQVEDLLKAVMWEFRGATSLYHVHPWVFTKQGSVITATRRNLSGTFTGSLPALLTHIPERLCTEQKGDQQ